MENLNGIREQQCSCCERLDAMITNSKQYRRECSNGVMGVVNAWICATIPVSSLNNFNSVNAQVCV